MVEPILREKDKEEEKPGKERRKARSSIGQLA